MIIPTISDLDALAPTNPIMISSEEIDETEIVKEKVKVKKYKEDF